MAILDTNKKQLIQDKKQKIIEENQRIIDEEKKLKDLKELPKTANANIKNALFVGSTAELQKMLKDGMLNNNSSE